MKKIVLHGSLKNHIPGGEFECEFTSPKEAASAIEVNWPGFRQKLKNMNLNVWQSNGDKEIDISEDQLHWTLGSNELHIAPAIEGAGGRTGKIIIGLALFATGIGAAYAAGGLTAAGFGAAAFGNSLGITAGQLALAGGLMAAGALFSPQMPTGDFSKNEQERKPSAIYRGPLNTQEQGVAMPLVFGFGVIAGGSVIHGELSIGQVSV